MALTPGETRQIAELVAVKQRVAAEYLRRPGVNGIGVGFKEVGGRRTERLAIRFHVAKKRTDLPKDEVLPTSIEGWPTDVIQANFTPAVGRAEPASRPLPPAADPDDEKYDPLVGGINIGVKAVGGYGTLGVMVRKKEGTNYGGEDMMLGNYHVMVGDLSGLGMDVCQPSAEVTITGWCSNCAEVVDGRLGNYTYDGVDVGLDAALARRTHRDVTRGYVAQVGFVAAPVAPRLTAAVKKRGAETQLTTGVIADVAYTVRKRNGVLMDNQFTVRGDGDRFSEPGDSGALIVETADNACVGLLWGTDTEDAQLSVASPIAAVFELLEVEL